MATKRTGRHARLYLNIGGSFGTPTWVECSIAKDVTANRSIDKIEDDCRGDSTDPSAKFKKYFPGKIDLSMDLEVCHMTGHACWDEIESAIYSEGMVDILFIDDDVTTSGAEGIRMEANVYEAENAQPLTDVMTDTYTFAPAAESTEESPARFQVA